MCGLTISFKIILMFDIYSKYQMCLKQQKTLKIHFLGISFYSSGFKDSQNFHNMITN